LMGMGISSDDPRLITPLGAAQEKGPERTPGLVS